MKSGDSEINSIFFPREETCLFTNDSPLNTIKVNPDKINLDEAELIGRGTFSRVFKSQLFGMDVAIKVFNPTPDKTDKEVKIFCLRLSSGFIFFFCEIAGTGSQMQNGRRTDVTTETSTHCSTRWSMPNPG